MLNYPKITCDDCGAELMIPGDSTVNKVMTVNGWNFPLNTVSKHVCRDCSVNYGWGRFIDLATVGKHVVIDDIDTFVESWHKGSSGLPLHEYLGMTEGEYDAWVGNHESLKGIIAKRQKQKINGGVA